MTKAMSMTKAEAGAELRRLAEIINQPMINTTFNYPTMAEAYRVAAFDGLNRLF